MIKNIVFAMFFSLLVLPGLAGAATFNGGESYALQADKNVSDNLYVGAGDISVAGAVLGDLIAAGGNLTVSGAVRDDLTLAGGNITVLGSVGGDIRIAGGSIVIGGSSIGGDLVIAGGTIKVLDGTTIGKDVVLTGGMVTFSGTGEHNARFAGGQVVIEGTIKGDVVIDANEKVVLGEGARIEGAMVYRGAKENILETRDGAVVVGGVQFEKKVLPVDRAGAAKVLAALFGIFYVIKLISFLIAGLIAALVFKRFSHAVVSDAVAHPWSDVLRGFIILVVVPIASIILLATFFGAFIGIALFTVYFLSLTLTALYSGIILGAWLYKVIKKEEVITVTWQRTLGGIIALSLVMLVPVIGWIVCVFFFLLALGAIAHVTHEKVWMNR